MPRRAGFVGGCGAPVSEMVRVASSSLRQPDRVCIVDETPYVSWGAAVGAA